VVGPAAGRTVALLDQHNKGTASHKSAISTDAGEFCVSSRYFGISGVYSGVLMLVTVVTHIHRCSVISTLRVNPLQYNCFESSWIVPKNRDETTCLAFRISSLFCYCADHCQGIKMLSFIMRASVPLCSMAYLSRLMYSVFPKSVCVLVKINFNDFCVCEAILCIAYWCYSKFWELYIYFTLKRNFEVRDSDVRDSCIGPTDIKTLLYTWGLTQGGSYVRARRKGVSQWLETQCGTTLFVSLVRKCNSVGCRKCGLFLVLILWLASEALLKSAGKRLLQERTTSIAARCYFAWNSTGCCDSHLAINYFRMISTFWNVTAWRWANSSWCFDGFYRLDLQCWAVEYIPLKHREVWKCQHCAMSDSSSTPLWEPKNFNYVRRAVQGR